MTARSVKAEINTEDWEGIRGDCPILIKAEDLGLVCFGEERTAVILGEPRQIAYDSKTGYMVAKK